jgi:hypothetical protein
MKRVSNWLAQLAAGALGALAAGASAGAAPAFVPLAHSSLVTVEAATDAGTLMLRVRRTPDQAPLAGAQLQVMLEGRSLPVTPRADGTWDAALGSLAASPDGSALEITVAHDGLREVLSGRLPGAAATAAGASGHGAAGTTASLLKAHKQLAWWILNIAVVLIGVIAVSRRMS